MPYLKTAFILTFRERRHVIIAVAAFLLVMLAMLWVASASTLGFILKSPVFSVASKAKLVALTLGGGFAVFKPATLAVGALIAALFGVNAAMTAHYFRCKAGLGAQAGTGVIGALVGMLGVGCAACGSVVIAAIFGAGVTAGLISILPFDGLEFGLLGALVLVISVSLVAKKIADPATCPLPKKP